MLECLHDKKPDWQSIRDILQKLGAPTTAEDLGVDREAIIKALVNAHSVRTRYTILAESGMVEPAAEKLVAAVGI